MILLIALLLDGCSIFKKGKKDEDSEVADVTEQIAEDETAVDEPVSESPEAAGAAPPPIPAESGRESGRESGGEGYVLNEINFEIKKLGAELKHQAAELRDLQAKSAMWANPLTIYNKEIILENGSTIFGKIVYQDEKLLKVETLIGYLLIERSTVVRIVENIAEKPLSDATALESSNELLPRTPQPANRVLEPTVPAGQPRSATPASRKSSFAPNIVLVGTVTESKDRTGNLLLKGKVKNIGGRRADFVKVNFVFRQDWSGNTKTLTSFVKGSFHTFESGITSDASLLPGATADVELYVAKSFGTFIGYSYTIDWEDY
ncbi:MAG: hypothetical protein V3W14_09560 [Candidatus Neomarinimicrobiota bacterium]